METEKNFARRILGIVVCLHNPSFSFHIVGHAISFQSAGACQVSLAVLRFAPDWKER